ncbi:MAG TPA: hypothetical protein VM735_11365 [Candidatus Kapabacteria bacterium]|nr:hypothetical protein [Candidatus Kapabacteria bacterium]
MKTRDVTEFHISVNPEGTGLSISGLVWHSGYGVKKMRAETRGTDLIVTLDTVFARKKYSGSFDYSVPIPPNVYRVLFGRMKK